MSPIFRIHDLQVYIDMEGNSKGKFYSQRKGGPLYHWRYNDQTKQWSSIRVYIKSAPSSFRKVAQTAIPADLQSALVNQYDL